MNRIIAATTLSLLTTTAAFAGATTITVLDSSSATKTYNVITDGAGTSGNFVSKMGLCDQAAAATCASVGTAGAPSTNALTVQGVTLGHGVAANAMRVELPTDGTGAVTANAGTNLNTSLLALESGGNLATLAGTVTSARAAVNPISAQAGVQGGAGVTTANTQRIAIATDANAVVLGAETTKVIGTVRVEGNVGGVFDAVVAGTYPANALAVGVLNGANIGRLVGDETNGLWVNVKAGAVSATISGFTPSGNYTTLTATGSSARAAMPTGSPTVVVAYNTGAAAVSCILGNSSVVAVANEDQIAPGGFFSYTVGSNTNLACIDQSGSTSNLVVLSGGSGIATGSGGGGGGGGGAITMASGAVASGAYSSGSIASGAYASGAVASGAFASGSLASGAMVDLVAEQTPIAPNTATATKALAIGGQYDSTQKTLTNGQQSVVSLSARGAQFVAVGADGFAVTGAGTSLADGLTFTEGTTSFTPVGGEYVSGGGASCVTGKGCTVQMTIDRMAYVNVGKMGGTAISSSCVSNYGTSPGSVACPSSNVFVTNSTTALPDNVDAVATTSSAANSPTNTYLYSFNGTTFDRVRSIKGGSIQVVNGGNTYQHVAASQTATVLQTSTGAAGDYLSHCVIYPSTTGAGSVTVFDNTNAASTNVIEFTTGTLSNLSPITLPVGAVSTAGAWKVTTGANETVVCYGKFS